MALDFHRLDNDTFLFGLDENKFLNIQEIFNVYENWTGILIDQYSDLKLSIENQKIIIKIIDTYINNTNLNLNKLKTIDIIEFRAFIKYYSDKNIDIKVLGD